MRAAFAGLRLPSLGGLAVVLHLAAACAPPAQGPLAGSSDAWNKTSEAAPIPQKPAPMWDAYERVAQWPAMNAEPFTSRGHQPEQRVDVHVSPEASATYSGLVADSVFPDGSVLAELPRAPSGHGYAMRKEARAWRFFELDSAGRVLAAGSLSLCAGCHAQAPADGVFGLPEPTLSSH